MTSQSIASRLAALALVALLANGCGSSPPPEPENAHMQAKAEAPSGEGETAEKAESPEVQAPAPAATGTKAEGPPSKEEAIPDDYSITEADCVSLGKRFAEVTKADQVAGLDPRLSEKQRAQVEKSIDDVAMKMGTTWTEGCLQSQVGKVVERKRLSCALEARTVKAFDTCINGE